MSDKIRLTALVSAWRDELLAFPQHLSGPHRAQVGSEQRWSAKDVVAHVAFWTQQAAADLTALLDGQPWPAERDDDAINQRVYAQYQNATWDDVNRFVRDSHEALLAFIAQHDEADLQRERSELSHPVWREVAGQVMHGHIHVWDYLRKTELAALNDEFNQRMAGHLLALSDDDAWRGSVHYNLACHYALSGRKAQALEKLAEALSLNPALKTWAGQDSDLAALHGDPAFQALIAE